MATKVPAAYSTVTWTDPLISSYFTINYVLILGIRTNHKELKGIY